VRAARLQFVFKFAYSASFAPVGSEREVCSVFVGRVGEIGVADPREVAGLRFVESERLDGELDDALYTPWFRLGWPTLREQYWHVVEAL
jgi:isopentenyl-diphosphate delta-isomerase